MYGLTRATMTLIGAALAGLLIYLAVDIADGPDETLGEYWAALGLFAAAGLVIALSQLLGGWTKWGWPRISGPVLLIAFVPVLIVSTWIAVAGQPEGEGAWLRGDFLNWSEDLGIDGFVDKMLFVLPLVVFGTGLVFGLTFDTSGPRVRKPETVITAPPRDDVVEHAEEPAVGAGATPEPERPPPPRD